MPKVKLIKVHEKNHYNEDIDYDLLNFDEVSHWEEISQADLDLLLGYKYHYQKQGFRIVVLEDVTNKQDIFKFVEDIKDFIEKEKVKLQKSQEKWKKDVEAKNALSAKRKLNKAKKLLEENGLKVT